MMSGVYELQCLHGARDNMREWDIEPVIWRKGRRGQMPLFVAIPRPDKNYSMKYLRFTMLSIFRTQMLEMHEQDIAKNYVTAILESKIKFG